MSIFCPHRRTKYHRVGELIELPKSHHEQGHLHRVRRPFFQCLDCGGMAFNKPWAEFAYWTFPLPEYNLPAVPVYNIRGPHTMCGCSVAQNVLWELGLRVPADETPPFEEWLAQQDLERAGSPILAKTATDGV